MKNLIAKNPADQPRLDRYVEEERAAKEAAKRSPNNQELREHAQKASFWRSLIDIDPNPNAGSLAWQRKQLQALVAKKNNR